MYVCNWKLPYIPEAYYGLSGLYLPFNSLKRRISLSRGLASNKLMFLLECRRNMRMSA